MSNLSFLSKLLERAVNIQLGAYLSDCSLLPSTQSAYRRNHSNETAVLKVSSNVLDTADRGLVTLLGLFDLNAAFDTVDHSYLLDCLKITFNINKNALTCFSSNLTGRTFQVNWNKNNSAHIDLRCGVPQGSVLGPLLFHTYTAFVIPLIINHGIPSSRLCG